MKPHPRIRKTIKWGGAAVTVLLVVVWLRSGWYGRSWGIGGCSVGTDAGAIDIAWAEPLVRRDFAFDFDLSALASQGGWCVHDFQTSWIPGRTNTSGIASQTIPIWPLIFGVGILSATAWRRDARAKKSEHAARLNHCLKCGYDRIGLAAGAVCPECGVAGAGGSGSGTLL